MLFSPERCIFLSNKRMNTELNPSIAIAHHPPLLCARRLECGRLVSIRWLENLDHMALARGKTKNEATVCDGLIPCVTLMCDPASSSGASFFARFRKEASAQREWLVLFLLGYLGYHGFTYFGFSVPSIFLADLLGNTCLLARVQKVMVCDSWLMDFDPLPPRFVALWSSCFG